MPFLSPNQQRESTIKSINRTPHINRLWQLLSTVIATLVTRLAAVYLFTNAVCATHGLFTLCIVIVSSVFSQSCIKPRGVMLPSLVPSFSTFIVDETSVICLSIVKPF